jgi:hypothetical protein
MEDLWSWTGKYIGYKEGENVWSADGKYLGKLLDEELFAPDGHYLGEICEGRLLVDRDKNYTNVAPFERHSDRSSPGVRSERANYSLPYGYEDFSLDLNANQLPNNRFETWARMKKSRYLVRPHKHRGTRR